MIKLQYISKRDGWAVIDINGGLRLLRPPYQYSGMVTVDESSLLKIINSGMFEHEEADFLDYRSLLIFLNEKVAAERGSDLLSTDEDMAYRLVKASSENDLYRQIEIINKNVGRGMAEELAEGLAFAIISRAKDLEIDKLVDDGLAIIKNIFLKRKERESMRDVFVDITKDFPLASSMYGKGTLDQLSTTMSERRNMFGFTARVLAI